MVNTIPLKKNNEFIRAYKKGRFHAGKYMVLYTLGNRSNCRRLGITASKKVGNSVKRNRIKRLIRENFRLYESILKNDLDFVFVAREFLILPSFHDIRKEMRYLFKRLECIEQGKAEL
jgi:ribonuclease P protein component